MRRRLLLAALGVLVLVIAAGVVAWQRADDSDPVDAGTAVEEFRAEPGPAAAPDDPPAPGVYTYAVSGWECGGLGPVCLRRELPATAQLTIRRDGGGIQERLVLSEQHGEGRTLVREDGGWRLAEQWSDLTFLGVGRETRDAAEPRPLVVPDGARDGQAWSERYRLREVPVEVASRIARRETVDVGGRAVEALVIESETTMGGALAGTIRETVWHAPSLGIDLRRVVSRRIDGSFRYELELDARLTSTIPAT